MLLFFQVATFALLVWVGFFPLIVDLLGMRLESLWDVR